MTFIINIYTINGQTFSDVPVSGSLTSVITKFQAKGFRLHKVYDNTGAIVLGTHMGRPVEIIITATPKTKQVFKYTVYLSKHTTWIPLLNDYRSMVRALTSKYGESTHEREEFLYPYDDGDSDGKEMTAVLVEKCQYMTAWLNKYQNNILVAISEYAQVKIVYENPILMDLHLKETDEVNGRIF